jgi:erythrin-vacuolar iron transport family protein
MEQHNTPEAARFFAAMAKNEEKHGEELRARRRVLFGDAPPRVTRAMLWDVEAPDYDQPRAFMSARQAMEVALVSETKALEFFVGALPHVVDPEVKRLFQDLRDEEILHQGLVREAMRNLPPGKDADPGDYEDEPVAQ